jgi:hypothetical protein
LALAGVDVHFAALHELGRSGGEHFFKGGQGFFILSLLEQLHGGLVVLE